MLGPVRRIGYLSNYEFVESFLICPEFTDQRMTNDERTDMKAMIMMMILGLAVSVQAGGTPKAQWMANVQWEVERKGETFQEKWFSDFFDCLDADDNGILESEEKSAEAKKTAKIFADSRGRVISSGGSSKAQWMAYMEKDCKKKGQTFQRKWFSDFFDRLDINENGNLEESENTPVAKKVAGDYANAGGNGY